MTINAWSFLPERARRLSAGLTISAQSSKLALVAHKRITDALFYSCGWRIANVVVDDDTTEHNDILYPDVLTIANITSAHQGKRCAKEFAFWCALATAHLWPMPDCVIAYFQSNIGNTNSIKNVISSYVWGENTSSELESLAARVAFNAVNGSPRSTMMQMRFAIINHNPQSQNAALSVIDQQDAELEKIVERYFKEKQ